MLKQLNIRSNEAHQIATRLARRLGTTTTAVVTDALREYSSRVEPESEVPPAEAAETFRVLMELSERSAKVARPGATSDHRDFYDDSGLPK